MRTAYLLILFMASLALAACGRKGEEAPATPATPVPTTASVAGILTVPSGVDAHSIMVFAEGTSFMALTGSTGAYEISGLKPGTYTIRAARPDLVSAVVDTVIISEADLAKPQPFLNLPGLLMDALDPTQSAAAFASRTRGSVVGFVTSQIPGDEMGVLVEIEGTSLRARTLEDGSYEIINVEPGEYNVLFSRPGYATQTVAAVVRAGDRSELPTVRLVSSADPAVAALSGEEPTADRVLFGTVEVLLADGTFPNDFTAVRVVLEGTSHSATPDRMGRFEMRGLPAGEYVVAANAPGFILDRKIPVSLLALNAAEVELTLLEDTIGGTGAGAIVGRVTFDEPPRGGMGGVSVAIAGTNLVAYTDDAGFYSILNVPAGERQLVANFTGYRPGSIFVNVRDEMNPTEVPDILLERDVRRPEVVYTDPAPGREVAIMQPTTISIQFNVPMDVASVQRAVSLAPPVGFHVVTRQRSMGSSNSFAIELDALPSERGAALRYGTRYTLTIARSASSDEGVTMKDDYVYNFTTGHAEIIATVPDNKARDVEFRFDTPIAVYFNAAIDTESIGGDDIDIRPMPPTGRSNVYFRRDPRTGWTIMYIPGNGEFDTNYRVSIRRSAQTVAGDRIRNLPYSFEFRTARGLTFEEFHGRTPPDYDETQRERDRRRR
jgi:hypothetical protein